ncbi:MAG: hypothetical protein ACXW07_08045 [Nitrososphaeraceae archaeon]
MNIIDQIMKIVNGYESTDKSNLIIDLLQLVPKEQLSHILEKLQNDEGILDD